MATASPHLRTYRSADVVSFRKTREAFGGLSNMAAGYPIQVGGIRIRTSEALYQACRFPHIPAVQKLIIEEVSPMTAKMRSKPYRRDSRPDWDAVRIPIMKWCLRVKLAQNWSTFGALLLETGDQPIVEDSAKDDFWGAMRDKEGILRGRNVLGRLLMELREKLRTEPESLNIVEPLPLDDFLLLSRPIPPVVRSGLRLTPVPIPEFELGADTNAPEQQHPATSLPTGVAPPAAGDVEPQGTDALQQLELPVPILPAAAPSNATEESGGAAVRDRRLTILAAAAGGLMIAAIIWFIAR